MKNLSAYTLLFFAVMLFFGCSSDDDCTKIIMIPQTYIIGNQSYSYDTEMEVSCDFPDPEEPTLIEPPLLENFSYEVLSFIYTPDTGNNTSRLQFEIKINNPNDYAVTGVPILTINSDGLEITGSFSQNASVPCYQIGANSNCILTFDQEDSLDIGAANSIELINVQYFLTN